MEKFEKILQILISVFNVTRYLVILSHLDPKWSKFHIWSRYQCTGYFRPSALNWHKYHCNTLKMYLFDEALLVPFQTLHCTVIGLRQISVMQWHQWSPSKQIFIEILGREFRRSNRNQATWKFLGSNSCWIKRYFSIL